MSAVSTFFSTSASLQFWNPHLQHFSPLLMGIWQFPQGISFDDAKTGASDQSLKYHLYLAWGLIRSIPVGDIVAWEESERIQFRKSHPTQPIRLVCLVKKTAEMVVWENSGRAGRRRDNPQRLWSDIYLSHRNWGWFSAFEARFRLRK